jgi:hypothetical protein
MGCWNGTCGISNLPINAGDEVVAFLIGFYSYNDNPSKSGYCYINDIATPLTLPIYGRYDDYGGIEDVEDTYVLEVMRRQFNLPDGTNVLEWINDRVERDEVTVEWNLFKDQEPRKVGVGLWMVHRHIFDAFKEKAGSWWTNDVKPYDLLKLDAKMFIGWVQERDPELLKALSEESIEDAQEHLPLTLRIDLWSFNNPRGEIGAVSYDNTFMLYGGFASCGYAGKSLLTRDFFRVYQPIMIKAIAEQDTDFQNQFVEDVAGYYCMESAMSSIRIGYNSHAGKGSQNNEYDDYEILIAAMQKVIKDRRKKEAEWD